MSRVTAVVSALLAASVLITAGVAFTRSDGVAERAGVSLGVEPARTAPTAAIDTQGLPEARAPFDGASGTTAPAADATELAQSSTLGAPVRSGLFSEVAVRTINRPVAIRVDDLLIASPVSPVGYDARKDEMEVPRSSSLVGWYEFSASPGENGSAVLAAHVDWGGKKGVFYDLHAVEVGTVVTIEYEDGAQRRFEVFAARQYGKQALPVDQVFTKEGGPILTLVTCGGLFDRGERSYRDNIVVYARPIDSAVAAPSGRL